MVQQKIQTFTQFGAHRAGPGRIFQTQELLTIVWRILIVQFPFDRLEQRLPRRG